ncbi:uncharacterized protein LOC127714481 [Mytilus californianus]|uniref:uncharacterized protein LOC127714481 n=1 Tax=Mytilus californianus TaxID=6549 RepID=UPI0022485C65|nr:uncharacterized protein LOC127714481 [Mytilus californianus]
MLLFSVITMGIYGFIDGLTVTELSKFTTSGNFPESTVRVDTTQSNRHLIYASGIPDHPWEKVNPNDATDQNYNISIPKIPRYNNGAHGCVPMGMIGITRTGVAIFNPLNVDLENAVEGQTQETFDSCDGHPTNTGSYHYHKIPDSCLYKGEIDEFIGVALDGFPIYGPNASDVNSLLTSTDLDECHGREVNGAYRYHATETWPYFLGCFKGVILENLPGLQYNCEPANKTSAGWEDWKEWNGYLCNCLQQGGQGGGNMPDPSQCGQNNPNRPANCPNVQECMNNNNPPMFCYDICQQQGNRPQFCQTLPVNDDSEACSVAAIKIYTVLLTFIAMIFI